MCEFGNGLGEGEIVGIVVAISGEVPVSGCVLCFFYGICVFSAKPTNSINKDYLQPHPKFPNVFVIS